VRLRPDETAMGRLSLPQGIWSVALEPAPPEATLAFACGGRSARHATGTAGALEVGRAGEVLLAIRLAAGTESWDLDRVVLRRLASAPAEWICDPDPDAPLAVPLADVAHPRPENGFWAEPGNLLLGEAGVRVQLPSVVRPTRIGLSLDGNDRYAVSYLRGLAVVAREEVGPRESGSGLAVWQIEVPRIVADGAGIDQIEVRPVSGDGSYSLGHLVFLSPAGR
jgi:hypothetical protein